MPEVTTPDQTANCILVDDTGTTRSIESESSASEICEAISHQHDVKRILVALGGAPAGESKLPVAEMFARALDADILFLHVLPRAVARQNDPISPAEARASAYLETVSARLHAAGLHAHGFVRAAASVTEGIVAAAREHSVDLIVLGLDVRGRVPRAFRQNVADEVARQTACPVVIVQPDQSARQAPVTRSFDEDSGRWGPLARWELGIRQVPIARVIGSVGRANEAVSGGNLQGSKLFLDTRRQRYLSVRSAMRKGVALPAVDLYKLGSGYYVVDGNHRIAAARELGQTEIDANVNEFVPLDDATAQRVFAERRSFERHTGLIDVDSAHYPGTYPRLQEYVDAYVARLEDADRTEGARRWYHRVYQPLVLAIHCRGLPRRFPGKQIADLAASVAAIADEEHLYGGTGDWHLVAERFVESAPRALARTDHAHGERASSRASAG
ncbi:MAG TPA: universal stress protein [Chloroflexota bacterium]|nr:universal stress protein [Chloroflexota bacterium]